VAFAVGHVTDQKVCDPLSFCASHRAPDLGAVGGCVKAVGERRAQALHEQLLVHQLADPWTVLGIEQRCLGRLGTVKGRVEAAVEQVHGWQIDAELPFGTAREQLLRDGHRVVVRDHDRRGDVLARPQRLDQVGLLVQ
jgi:hypothetical protein